ncbi:prepilin peptidase [Paludisphaera borealis]|uniref:Leader peptidase PppA n=1 Tax=Paludisphaera borealis TaxID=1387353 RepID=A0A1U7CYU8_9BACT|nr:prepilin peptidase [Paludisphaera borealis]APW64132.1 Leader peptidase PppA [Paludisphaera borealis]
MTFVHHATLIALGMVVGSCVGSFLNVCVYRVPRGRSVLNPPSSCPCCGSSIRARDNVPVLGWIFLGGTCRDCGGRISIRYPLIELATGLLFATVYLAHLAAETGDMLERCGPWLVGFRVVVEPLLILTPIAAVWMRAEARAIAG